MMFQRVLLSLFLALAGTVLTVEATAQHQAASRAYYPVRLIAPNAGGGKGIAVAEVNADKKCQFRTHDGCMLFPANTVGVIDFYLPGPPHKTKCSNSPSNTAKHVITKIELSTTALEQDYTKGNFGGEVLPWLKEFAFDDVNQSNGVVYDETWQNGRTNVTLTNLNSHPNEYGGVNSFWYKVTVTKCSDQTTTIFDPRGDNEGLH